MLFLFSPAMNMKGSSNSSKRIHVPLEIFGHMYFGLIDTGSTHSFVSEAVLQQLAVQVALQDIAMLANGTKTLTTEEFNLSVCIQSTKFEGKFRMLPSLTVDVLLGTDWMYVNEVIIDVCRNNLYIKGKRVITVSTSNPLERLQLPPSTSRDTSAAPKDSSLSVATNIQKKKRFRRRKTVRLSNGKKVWVTYYTLQPPPNKHSS